MILRASVPRVAPNIATHRHDQRITPVGNRRCDCGAPTEHFNWACERCRFLDQSSGRSAGAVVSALRDARYLTINDICEITKRSHRNTVRVLDHLVAIGRCVRLKTEVEALHAFGGDTWCWTYRLI